MNACENGVVFQAVPVNQVHSIPLMGAVENGR